MYSSPPPTHPPTHQHLEAFISNSSDTPTPHPFISVPPRQLIVDPITPPYPHPIVTTHHIFPQPWTSRSGELWVINFPLLQLHELSFSCVLLSVVVDLKDVSLEENNEMPEAQQWQCISSTQLHSQSWLAKSWPMVTTFNQCIA